MDIYQTRTHNLHFIKKILEMETRWDTKLAENGKGGKIGGVVQRGTGYVIGQYRYRLQGK